MDDERCYRHTRSDCDVCPYYDYEVTWEHGKRQGRFWIGQRVILEWGTFGDGITLTPGNQGQGLNA